MIKPLIFIQDIALLIHNFNVISAGVKVEINKQLYNFLEIDSSR